MSALPSKADIDRPAFAAPRRASRSNKRTGDSPWGSEVALAITLGDFDSQIRQRNLGTKLRDQILLAVLTCPHFSHESLTMSPGYSRSASEPVIETGDGTRRKQPARQPALSINSCGFIPM